MAISPEYFNDKLEEQIIKFENEIDETLKNSFINLHSPREFNIPVPVGLNSFVFNEYIRENYLAAGWRIVEYMIIGKDKREVFLRFVK